MVTRSSILIGIGGSGSRLIRQIASYSGAGDSGRVLRILTIDTDTESRTASGDHFSLGGFQLDVAVDRLDPNFFSPERLAELRSLRLNVNMGAAARADIGRVALEVHRKELEDWLFRHVTASAALAKGPLRVFVVGSLCGGTGAGVLPELGYLLRRVLRRAQEPAALHGFGLASSLFGRIFHPELARSLSHNQEHAVTKLTASSPDSTFAGYNDFYIVDVRFGAPMDSAEVLESIAQRIVAGWVLGEQSTGTPGDAERLRNSEGAVLLAVSDFRRPEMDVLWTPGLHLAAGADRVGLPSGDLAFYIPSFRRHWAEQIDQFRRLVNNPRVSELELQRFLETNPGFLTGFDYQRAVPHVYLHGSPEGDLIPDFMLIPFDSDLADVLELKHPRQRIVVQQSGHARVSACLLQAMAQLRDYEEFFDREENRERIRNQYGFTAYKPKLSVVIGTRSSMQSELLFRRVTAPHPEVNVITYDDILARAARFCR
jgi:hypothetical protein